MMKMNDSVSIGMIIMIRKQLAVISFLIGIMSVALPMASLGQTTMTNQGLEADTKKLPEKNQTSYGNSMSGNITTPALEGAINPEMYYVGPSDIMSVNIWLSPPLSFILTVTPEGTLVIPTVGEVKIADMSLAEAKKQILREIKKKYLTGEPTVTLISPRRVLIMVKGNVPKVGLVTLLATDRVEAAIRQAEKTIANRNIMINHKDGTSQRIDVPKYYATKDDRWNPLVRDGDEVFIPKVDANKNVISIWGGVNVEGTYE